MRTSIIGFIVSPLLFEDMEHALGSLGRDEFVDLVGLLASYVGDVL